MVQLNFDMALLLLLSGVVSLNTGPGWRNLHMGTVDARSIWDKANAFC